LPVDDMARAEIAKALNGTVNGKWINVRGPGHSSQDRSLGIKFDPKAPDGFIVTSLAGDDQPECRAYVKSLLSKLNGEFCATYEPNHAHAVEAVARAKRAMFLWHEAKSPKQTIVETYLRNRGCKLGPVTGADMLRFHPNCPFKALGGPLRTPAMLALITDAVTGEPIGVHRTAIKDDGSGKRELGDGISSKQILGAARRGAIRLHAASEHIGIAEGIETALSASQVLGTAVWATLSSTGIATFPVLKGAKYLTVFADHDHAGAQAARRCCLRYQGAGIDAKIHFPPDVGADWNDFVMKGNC
jgi:putative DNA primase/helicase